MDTLAKLQDIIRNVFDDDSLLIARATTAQDVDAWDSVQNISLVMDIEQAFAIRFSTSEIAYLRNVGELADLIDTKLAAKK